MSGLAGSRPRNHSVFSVDHLLLKALSFTWHLWCLSHLTDALSWAACSYFFTPSAQLSMSSLVAFQTFKMMLSKMSLSSNSHIQLLVGHHLDIPRQWQLSSDHPGVLSPDIQTHPIPRWSLHHGCSACLPNPPPDSFSPSDSLPSPWDTTQTTPSKAVPKPAQLPTL